MGTKLVQAEWNTKKKTKFFSFMPEAMPNLYKVSASRVEYKEKDEVFFFYARGDA